MFITFTFYFFFYLCAAAKWNCLLLLPPNKKKGTARCEYMELRKIITGGNGIFIVHNNKRLQLLVHYDLIRLFGWFTAVLILRLFTWNQASFGKQRWCRPKPFQSSCRRLSLQFLGRIGSTLRSSLCGNSWDLRFWYQPCGVGYRSRSSD